MGIQKEKHSIRQHINAKAFVSLESQLILKVGGVDSEGEMPLLCLLEKSGEEEGVGVDSVDQFALHLRSYNVCQ